MIPTILSSPRGGGHRLIVATPAEYVRLFGWPPPLLPPGESRPGEGEVIQVVMPAELDTLAGRYLEALIRQILHPEGATVSHRESIESESEYQRYLESIVRYLARIDRRTGILNLFWLAHIKTLRTLLLSLLARDPKTERNKYRLWPILNGTLRRALWNAFASLTPAEKRRIAFSLGGNCNWGIINALMEDQFVLTEADVRQFRAAQVLGPHNPDSPLSGAMFTAILTAMEQLFQAYLARHDAEFTSIVRRRSTGFATRHGYLAMEKEEQPLLCHDALVRYYLASPQLLAEKNQAIAAAADDPAVWARVAEEFDRTVMSLRRVEYLQFFQDAIAILPPGLDDSQIKELFLEGRLYKFSLSLPVVNNFRTVVILFADIREFTRTSETAISERELTEKLYDVFDPLVHIVGSLGGTVDKFTGDGMMVTFGAEVSLAEANLRAMRCAVAMQEAVERLRKAGRTAFRMGISLHSGRVYVANFMTDEEEKQTTVIGRQVNLAGRLSSTHSFDVELPPDQTGKIPLPLPEGGLRGVSPSAVGAVFLDHAGQFYNVGVAASGQFVQDLLKTTPMENVTRDGLRGYVHQDRYLKSEVWFYYVGGARFKGFRDSTPVYGISWRRLEPGESGEGGETA